MTEPSPYQRLLIASRNALAVMEPSPEKTFLKRASDAINDEETDGLFVTIVNSILIMVIYSSMILVGATFVGVFVKYIGKPIWNALGI